MLFLSLTTLIFQFFSSFLLASIFNSGVVFFLSFFALVVLNVQILSLFKAITPFGLFLLILAEAVVIAPIWFFKGKPLLKFKKPAEILDAFKKDKWLFVLFAALFFMVFISFFLIIFSPPNEADASSYHALRALFWAHDGFISHFDIADIRCHSMPINSELFYVFILALTKNDIGFGFLQFFSYFLLIISSNNIMKIYNIDIKKRLWSIFIFSSFAGVISQISSTQTDLTIGALLCTSIYLILKYKNTEEKNKKLYLLYFASLSTALSFGVKSTGVIGSIPLLIWFIFLLRKDFIKFFPLLILNFLLFSSYNYILNFINYGNFLGAKTAINEHSLWFTSPLTFLAGGISNIIRYFLMIFDFSGLPLFYLLTPLYDNIVHFIFDSLNINPLFNSNGEIPALNATLSEQRLGFGILSVLALFPASIVSLFNKKIRIFTLIFLIQTIILSFSIVYFPTTVRFFTGYSVLLIPALTCFYDKKNYKKLISLIAIFYLIFTPLFLVQRPFLKIYNEFKLNPSIKKVTDNIRDVRYKFYFISKEHIFLKDGINEICNKNDIGLFLGEGFMAYPVKYLDFKNKCNIDFLTVDKPLDYSKYDYIVFEKGYQEISTVKDFSPSVNCIITDYMGRATGKLCEINENVFKPEFILYKTIVYRADDFLKKTGNDNDTEFYILKNSLR